MLVTGGQQMAQQPGAGGALAMIRSITVWLEDENGVKRPTVYEASRCILGGLKDGVAVARVLDEGGDVVDYFGCQLRVIQAPPSGLVAPEPGSGATPFRST